MVRHFLFFFLPTSARYHKGPAAFETRAECRIIPQGSSAVTSHHKLGWSRPLMVCVCVCVCWGGGVFVCVEGKSGKFRLVGIIKKLVMSLLCLG